jgi:hypothetical protein
MNAFIKAGTNLEKEIYPSLKYKGLYMPEFAGDHICDHKHTEEEAEEEPTERTGEDEPIPMTYAEVLA